MFALILDDGIVTVSWYALLALRTRDSMSAMGSVMVMLSDRIPFSLRFLPTPSRDPRDFRGNWRQPGSVARLARHPIRVGRCFGAGGLQQSFCLAILLRLRRRADGMAGYASVERTVRTYQHEPPAPKSPPPLSHGTLDDGPGGRRKAGTWPEMRES